MRTKKQKIKTNWTIEKKQFLIENVVNTEKHLCELFKQRFKEELSITALRNQKAKLHIKSGLIGGRFEKGHASPNKGKKWSEYLSAESQEKLRQTCFKKGNIPHNHKPIGTEVQVTDGYIKVKIAEPNKWALKHRLVWTQANGEIPKGVKIIFLDGDRTNCDLSNLAAVKDAEELIMNRHGLFKQNKELTTTGVNIAKLSDKIYKLERNKK